MDATVTMYSAYFRKEQQAKGIVSRADGGMVGFTGLISGIKNDLLTIDLLGSTGFTGQTIESGTEASVTTTNGWTAYRCKAVVARDQHQRELLLRLVGPVSEKQKRENFRLDVSLPFSYLIPECQKINDLKAVWNEAREVAQSFPSPIISSGPAGPRLVRWNKDVDIDSSIVNLSANGIRFKTSSQITPRTFLLLYLFLPLAPPQVIPLVTEVLRCQEMETCVSRRENFSVAMRFRLIHDKDRESLVAFIFEEQRRLLRARSGLET